MRDAVLTSQRALKSRRKKQTNLHYTAGNEKPGSAKKAQVQKRNGYLPENKYQHYHLRQRPHNKALIPITTYLSDRDYIMRMLYKNCY